MQVFGRACQLHASGDEMTIPHLQGCAFQGCQWQLRRILPCVSHSLTLSTLSSHSFPCQRHWTTSRVTMGQPAGSSANKSSAPNKRQALLQLTSESSASKRRRTSVKTVVPTQSPSQARFRHHTCSLARLTDV